MKLLAYWLIIGTALGQNPVPKSDAEKPKPIHSSAVTKCRSELDVLDNKKFEDFQGFPTSKLKVIRETLETCLADSYEALTKYQLASAGIMLEWTERTVYQRFIDEQSTGRRVGSTESKEGRH